MSTSLSFRSLNIMKMCLLFSAPFESSEFSRPAIKNERSRREYDDEGHDGGYNSKPRDYRDNHRDYDRDDRRPKSSQPPSRQNTRPWDDDEEDEDYPPSRSNHSRQDRDDRDRDAPESSNTNHRFRDREYDGCNIARDRDNRDPYQKVTQNSNQNNNRRIRREEDDEDYAIQRASRGGDGRYSGGRNRDSRERDASDDRDHNRDGYRSSTRRDDFHREDNNDREKGDTWDNKKAEDRERDPYRTKREWGDDGLVYVSPYPTCILPLYVHDEISCCCTMLICAGVPVVKLKVVKGIETKCPSHQLTAPTVLRRQPLERQQPQYLIFN